MSIQVKTKHILFAILGLVLATFILGWYIGAKKADNANKDVISQLKDIIDRREIELNNTKTYIVTVEQENRTLRQAKKEGDISREELRKLNLEKVNELTRAKATISILRDSVKHNGKIVVIHDTVKIDKQQKAILLPFDFSDSTKYVNLFGRFDDNGYLGYKLTIPAEFSVYTGVDKKGKTTCTIATSNPYIRIEGLSSVKFDMPSPKKWGFGVIGGYGIGLSPAKAQPFIGVGLSYDFFRF